MVICVSLAPTPLGVNINHDFSVVAQTSLANLQGLFGLAGF